MIDEKIVKERVSKMVQKYHDSLYLRNDLSQEQKDRAVEKYRTGLFRSFGFAFPYVGLDEDKEGNTK